LQDGSGTLGFLAQELWDSAQKLWDLTPGAGKQARERLQKGRRVGGARVGVIAGAGAPALWRGCHPSGDTVPVSMRVRT
jgi:hypothetical protein